MLAFVIGTLGVLALYGLFQFLFMRDRNERNVDRAIKQAKAEERQVAERRASFESRLQDVQRKHLQADPTLTFKR